MIEPILTLAISMHSNPGVYALLLGSGLSRSAGIPTGWDIVLDLIRKLAVVEGEDCEPRPDNWYRNQYGEGPDYSKILDQLGRLPAERQQLLRGYFEPNEEEEREQGMKLPTVAHQAIAGLVAKGYVRVIITTNFDRLTERALDAAGVVPTVISSADHIRGAMPLAHTQCTIIKIHGDYIDTRIRNTPEELAGYEPPMNDLLDRVFDEYGLIVSGWSAQWDPALRAAVERCPNRRFTTFWSIRGEVTEEAKGLIEHRRAELIEVEGADAFFQELSEKVQSLEQISARHPLSAPVAVATLKRYLHDERQRIRVRDLIMDEANRLHEQLSDESFPVDGRMVKDDSEFVAARVTKYEALTEVLRALVATGCYWGDKLHEDTWRQCLERIADHGGAAGGLSVLIDLRMYPALLLAYAGGIAAVAARNYGNLAALLVRARGREPRDLKVAPLAVALNPTVVIRDYDAQHMMNSQVNHYTPINDYLHRTLRNTLRDLLPRDADYDDCYTRFEYLFALVSGDQHEKLKAYPYFPVGRFVWSDRGRSDLSQSMLDSLYNEIESAAGEWPGLKAGLFDGTTEGFQSVKKRFDEELPDIRRSLRVR